MPHDSREPCQRLPAHLAELLELDAAAGVISATERTELLSHAQSCDRCRLELDHYRRTVALLRALPRRPAPGDLAERVRMEILARGSRTHGVPPRWVLAAAAALLLSAGGLVLLVFQGSLWGPSSPVELASREGPRHVASVARAERDRDLGRIDRRSGAVAPSAPSTAPAAGIEAAEEAGVTPMLDTDKLAMPSAHTVPVARGDGPAPKDRAPSLTELAEKVDGLGRQAEPAPLQLDEQSAFAFDEERAEDKPEEAAAEERPSSALLAEGAARRQLPYRQEGSVETLVVYLKPPLDSWAVDWTELEGDLRGRFGAGKVAKNDAAGLNAKGQTPVQEEVRAPERSLGAPVQAGSAPSPARPAAEPRASEARSPAVELEVDPARLPEIVAAVSAWAETRGGRASMPASRVTFFEAKAPSRLRSAGSSAALKAPEAMRPARPAPEAKPPVSSEKTAAVGAHETTGAAPPPAPGSAGPAAAGTAGSQSAARAPRATVRLVLLPSE